MSIFEQILIVTCGLVCHPQLYLPDSVLADICHTVGEDAVGKI